MTRSNNEGGVGQTMPEIQHQVVSDKLDDIKERLVIIETKMEQYKGIDKFVHDALTSTTAAHKRLDRMEDTLTWVWRIIGGAIIVELLRALMTYGVVK